MSTGSDLSEHFQCAICLDILSEPHETLCCHQLFCKECLIALSSTSHVCPFCRKNPIAHSPSGLALRLMANITMPCPLQCGISVQGDKYWKHQQNDCPKRPPPLQAPKIAIPPPDDQNSGTFIEQMLGQLQLQLTSSSTRQTLPQIRHGLTTTRRSPQSQRMRSPSRSQSLPTSTPSNTISPNAIAAKRNADGGLARLGRSGKHYCGGPLDFTCECCDGFCGPSSGCNCSACMALDIETRQLPINTLVNSDGAVTEPCDNGTWYCGRRMPELQGRFDSDGYCGPDSGPQCQSCEELQPDRYEALINHTVFGPTDQDRVSPRRNSDGRMARLGSTGKFYCCGEIDCFCCDGRCGPSDGCNCRACSRLDREVGRIPESMSVNREGALVRRGEHQVWYCGRRMPELQDRHDCDGYCGPDNSGKASATRPTLDHF
ncbi:hypothetical protein BJ742DRAFT_780328 [Cladochytrium replicatum]|nr:hypothetical protein BJ742DRAFT_780328 [Cladochytrium replicatum]